MDEKLFHPQKTVIAKAQGHVLEKKRKKVDRKSVEPNLGRQLGIKGILAFLRTKQNDTEGRRVEDCCHVTVL